MDGSAIDQLLESISWEGRDYSPEVLIEEANAIVVEDWMVERRQLLGVDEFLTTSGSFDRPGRQPSLFDEGLMLAAMDILTFEPLTSVDIVMKHWNEARWWGFWWD